MLTQIQLRLVISSHFSLCPRGGPSQQTRNCRITMGCNLIILPVLGGGSIQQINLLHTTILNDDLTPPGPLTMPAQLQFLIHPLFFPTPPNSTLLKMCSHTLAPPLSQP